MLGTSPTQQPPVQVAPDQKRPVHSTPARRQPGQSPTARFFKALFRPLLKGIYYLIRGIREHFRLALVIILLLAISITATNYLTTGQLPFGVGNDSFNFHIHGTSGGGDLVKSWIYHLREGNATALRIDERAMPQPPEPTQLINQYSPKSNLISWKEPVVVGLKQEDDSSIDSYVEIDVVTHGPGGDAKGVMQWHFVTFSQGGGILYSVDLVGSSIRPALA